MLTVQYVKLLCTYMYMYLYITCTICKEVVCLHKYSKYELIEECCVHVPSVPSTECVSADSDNEEPYQLQQVGTTPHVTHVKHPCTIH